MYLLMQMWAMLPLLANLALKKENFFRKCGHWVFYNMKHQFYQVSNMLNSENEKLWSNICFDVTIVLDLLTIKLIYNDMQIYM